MNGYQKPAALAYYRFPAYAKYAKVLSCVLIKGNEREDTVKEAGKTQISLLFGLPFLALLLSLVRRFDRV